MIITIKKSIVIQKVIGIYNIIILARTFVEKEIMLENNDKYF